MISAPGSEPLVQASVVALRDGVEVVAERRVVPDEYEPARSRALRAFLEGATVDRLTAPEQVVERRVRLDVPPCAPRRPRRTASRSGTRPSCSSPPPNRTTRAPTNWSACGATAWW